MTEDLSELAAAFIDEPEPTTEAAPQTRTSLRVRLLGGAIEKRRVVPVVAVLAASNIALAVLLFLGGAEGRDRAAVHDVAQRFAHSLVTFDYRTLEADIKRIQSDATGNFQSQLASVLGGGNAVFKDALAGAQAHSGGKVHGVDVTSVGEDTATALVAVDQTITNKEAPDPQTISRRLHLTLVRTAKGWKVDSVDARET